MERGCKSTGAHDSIAVAEGQVLSDRFWIWECTPLRQSGFWDG